MFYVYFMLKCLWREVSAFILSAIKMGKSRSFLVYKPFFSYSYLYLPQESLASFIFHISRIWKHFLCTLSLVTQSRSCYRKLNSPWPSCSCNYSISWLDSAYTAANRVPHCKTISTLRIIYYQSSPDIWPLKSTCDHLMTYFNFGREPNRRAASDSAMSILWGALL